MCSSAHVLGQATGAAPAGLLVELPFVAEQHLEVAGGPTLSGFGFQAPSRPLVIVSPPLPLPNLFVQPKPCCCEARALGLGPHEAPRSPAPWALPNVCPPAISATVSSSFIAMRAKGLADRLRGRELPGRDCRSGPRGSRRSGPSGSAASGSRRVRGRPGSASSPSHSVSGPSRCPPRAPRRPRARLREAERLEAHRLECDVSREDHQVGPRDLRCRTSA